jgi:hypothetical protein
LIFVSLCRGSSDASLVRDGGECTGEGLHLVVLYKYASGWMMRGSNQMPHNSYYA